MKWDAVEPLRFYYVVDASRSGKECSGDDLAFKTVQLGLTVDRGDVCARADNPSADPAFVGVIDGKRVRVTPFGQVVVPPPISAFELCLPHNVKQVIKPNVLLNRKSLSAQKKIPVSVHHSLIQSMYRTSLSCLKILTRIPGRAETLRHVKALFKIRVSPFP